MTFLDLLRFASTALTRSRLRSVLSLTGVAIGVTAVTLLTALGEGARRYVTGQFESLGTNLVIVIPGKNDTQGAIPGIGGAPNDLTIADAEAIARNIPEVNRIVPVVVGPETVSRQQRSRQILVIGATHDFLQVRRLTLGQGRFLPPLDPRRSVPVAVLGSKVAQELFPGENPVGQVVRLGDWRLRVTGVLADSGTRMGLAVEELVIIPVGTGMKLFNRTSLFRILMDVSAHAEVDRVCERALEVIKERHDDEEDVTILTQDSVMDSFSSILYGLTLAVGAIAAISLSVAGIGIMNVMLVSVSERTAEVGLLKALGATHRQVMAVFLAEAILLSTSGGLLGLAIGFGAGRAIMAFYPDVDLTPPLWAVLSALGVSIACGGLFGVIPARQASRLDPVAALARRVR